MAKGRYPLAAEFVEQMLQEDRFTVSGLANAVGVSVQQVYRWRDGDTSPDPKHWAKIETYFELPGAISQLYGLTPSGPRPTYAQRLDSMEHNLSRKVPREEFDELAERFGRLEEAVLAFLDQDVRPTSGTVTPIRQGKPEPAPDEALPEAAHKKKGRGPARRPNPPVGGDD